jgi:hypothetical protein
MHQHVGLAQTPSDRVGVETSAKGHYLIQLRGHLDTIQVRRRREDAQPGT